MSFYRLSTPLMAGRKVLIEKMHFDKLQDAISDITMLPIHDVSAIVDDNGAVLFKEWCAAIFTADLRLSWILQYKRIGDTGIEQFAY